jgi:Fur family peroxide stress response transcriptional regulator
MEQYRDIGFKLTPQRLAILDYLDGNTSHPSAEEIFGAVKTKFPTMSFATVYNTLEALRDRGKLLELTIDPARKRYDPNTNPHHHLICIKCGTVKDIHKEFKLDVSKEVGDSFQVMGSHIEFYAICPNCS